MSTLNSNPNYTSVLLRQQESLFRILDTSIKIDISADGHTLIARNITEADMINLTMVTNSSSYNERIEFKGVEIFLNNQLNPSPVYGFYSICLQSLEIQDVEAFAAGKKTYQPFLNGFQNAMTVNQLCDHLSALSVGSPDTYGSVKTYTVYFYITF